LDNGEAFVKADGNGAEDIEKMFSPPGFFTVRLDGGKLSGKEELLSALAAGLRFPAYFGHNWDALLDCLRSLPEFLRAAGYAVIIERSGRLLADSPDEMKAFRGAVNDAAAFLRDEYGLELRIIML